MTLEMTEQFGADLQLVEVYGNGMLPLYRHSDRLLISTSMPISTGDRIAVKLECGEVLAGSLTHRGQDFLVIARGGLSGRAMYIKKEAIDWMGRIAWASQ